MQTSSPSDRLVDEWRVEGRTFVYPEDVDSATTQAECTRLWELAADKTCLELGSWKGATAISMAQSAQVVHAVDHFQGDAHTGFGSTLGEYLKNLGRYGMTDKIVTHIGSFEQILPILGREFDLIFIDGLHTVDATETQIGWAMDLVQPGGVLAFHDYTEEQELVDAGFGVVPAVNKWFGFPGEVVDTLAIVEMA